jgi:NAD(P)-dependent dehydrogenase (short-subunit alcohol dehydrogenase family)
VQLSESYLPRLLDGKVAVVTGGGGGIGGATARTLAANGARVAVLDIDERAGGRVAEDITAASGQACLIAVDLAREESVEAAVDEVMKRYGRIDVLHNNAALTESDFLSRDTTITELDLEVWDRAMNVNLRSQMLMSKHVVPHMVAGGGGSIINMSSGAAFRGDRTRTAYGVSKAGVHALTLYTATSHGKNGVRVNTIVPGLIITDAVRAHLTPKVLEGLGSATLTPYVGEPQDVADLVLFLASEKSRYITGQTLTIDGGMSAHVSGTG